MIGVIGLDHHATSAELLGRLTFSGERLQGALRSLVQEPTVREAAIVSTCNRTELYVATEAWSQARRAVQRLLVDSLAQTASPISAAAVGDAPRAEPVAHPAALAVSAVADYELPSELAEGLYEYEGIQAVRHLLQVAAGLRSLVVGEAQILGQVREALASAEAAQTAGDELRAAFALALRFGKRVRTETALGQADVSVAALAVGVVRQVLGTLEGASALVIGAGRTSRLCATLLREAGVKQLFLANRTPQAAADLARDVGGEAISLADMAAVIGSVQLIVSATAAPHIVLSADTVAQAIAGRSKPLVIVDLAVPQDVEAPAGLLPNVSLYTLDTLRAGGLNGDELLPQREAELAEAEHIVDEGVREFARLSAMRMAVPGIAALRVHVDRSEQAELDRALAQLSHLSPEDHAIVERFGRRLVDKMFHHLVARIRSLAEFDEVPPEVTLRVLSRLFAEPETPGRRENLDD